MKIRVGIFFGGPSREREISFAGGRTVYDNLNQSLFTPVAIFVDSHRNWVLLDWEYIYKGSIRDFFPPVAALPPSKHDFQIYAESIAAMDAVAQQALLARIGQPVKQEDILQHIDIAFLALHGVYGEDGELQQQLDSLGVPYTGSGIEASKVGMDKALQKELMQERGFACPKVKVLSKTDWLAANVHDLYRIAIDEIGFPLVIRPANQGSSIGVNIIDESVGLEGFEESVNRAFFRELIPLSEWHDRSDYDKLEYVKFLADIRDGLGFPMTASLGSKRITLHHPEALLTFLNKETAAAEHLGQLFVLEAQQSEQDVILEEFIRGKEFSCIVMRGEDGSSIALPPTEIIKGGEVFDYRSKYMPGLSRKETPINLPDDSIESIRRECEHLFNKLGFQVYARIDGFYTPEGAIYLNDPNTTSGMLPSSFFFHQAAEIGLTPSQFLTYIVRISLQERLVEHPEMDAWHKMLKKLDEQISQLQEAGTSQKTIGVILGGYSFERHISVESGRNIFEKLSSAIGYEPLPIFLTGSTNQHLLYQLPINLLLKDNADDIKDKISNWKTHPLLEKIRLECAPITKKYASKQVVFSPQEWTYDSLRDNVDGAFIALHGRPGEDGEVQQRLDARQVPYNGSGVRSSSNTIDKYRTLQMLKKHGLTVAEQLLLPKTDFVIDAEGFFKKVERTLSYPFIAKPVDDGCSSAVKVIKNREELQAYTALVFRLDSENEARQRKLLKLKTNEEFSHKEEILFEELIVKGDGIHFLEITGGMLTSYDERGQLQYELFEPSEALASGEILSLEEKFLAGEGQNLTPARLAVSTFTHEDILPQVQRTLERAARILGVEGYCRIDAFVRVFADGKAETQIIEINSLPGMTPATAIFHQAALANYKPAVFIHKILEFGFARQAKRKGATSPVTAVATTAPIVKAKTIKETNSIMDKEQTKSTVPKAGKRRFHNRIIDLVKSRFLWKNIAAMLVTLGVLFLGLRLFLNMYTHHGSSVQVENYVGANLENAFDKATSRGFKVHVNEASFDMGLRQGEVIDQEPEALNRIKKNRTIYLTVIGEPKEIEIPSFEDAADDYSQYRHKLRPLQVRSVVKESVFDAKLADSTILHVFYQGRKYSPSDVKRGIKVLQGTTLEFVVTKSKDDFVRIPDLVCKNYSEVSFLLPGLDLSVGEVVGNVNNRSESYIWKQEPAYRPGGKIARGAGIKIYIQEDLPVACAPEEVETNEPPSDAGGQEGEPSIGSDDMDNDF